MRHSSSKGPSLPASPGQAPGCTVAQLLGLPSCLTQARGRAPGVGSLPFKAQGFSVHPFFQNPEDNVACWLREQQPPGELGPSVSLPLSSGRDLASPHRLSASEEMVPRLPRAVPLHGSTRLASLPRVGRGSSGTPSCSSVSLSTSTGAPEFPSSSLCKT